MTIQQRQNLLLIGNILWVFAIFILCALPQKDIPDPHLDIPHLDKVVHMIMFFIMSLLISNGLDLKGYFQRKRIYVLAVSISFVYGGILEILQYYFFNRGGDAWDLLADVVGGIAGCVCYSVLRKKMPRLLGFGPDIRT